MQTAGMVLLVVISATGKTIAQSYRPEPGDTVAVSTGKPEDTETLVISQYNISTDTLVLEWQKVSADIPSSWEASICDNVTCNPDLADHGSMAPVGPGKSGFLLLHITPHRPYGRAVVRYAVWDRNLPAGKDTLTFILTASEITGIDPLQLMRSRINPTPANTTLEIETGTGDQLAYTIRDLNGAVLMEGMSPQGSATIPTTGLLNGLYLLSLTRKQMTETKKLIIQH